ncbi:DMT family transporter [Oceanobacillus sp. SE10311]
MLLPHQKYTTPARTELIFSLKPVFAALFGYIFINEVMGSTDYIGALLVIAGVIISSTNKKGENKRLLSKNVS